MKNHKELSWLEQVSLLRSRGMNIGDDAEKILATVDKVNHTVNYEGLNFSLVLKRYYQDKNLRLNWLHAIEQIEVALKTKLAYILGKFYGDYGYLNFYRWSNRSKFTNFVIEKRQYYFKEQLLRTVNKLNVPYIKKDLT